MSRSLNFNDIKFINIFLFSFFLFFPVLVRERRGKKEGGGEGGWGKERKGGREMQSFMRF
jgi:hypothetical protein